MKYDELESFFGYRLIKIIYFVSLIFLLLVVTGLGTTNLPKKYIDYDTSYILCDNGNRYSFSNASVYPNTSTNMDLQETYNLCKTGKRFFSLEDEAPKIKNYSLEMGYTYEGSWGLVISVWLIGVSIVYSILNITKEMLIYLFFGRKLTWSWLKFWKK